MPRRECASLKSLRDSLLEYAVLRASRLFPCRDRVRENGESPRSEVVDLPPNLFDQILEKSCSMLWRIPDDCLVSCLRNRDRVRWQDVSYFTADRLLSPGELELVYGRGPPVSKLCLKLRLETPKDLEILEGVDRLAGTLKSLRLNFEASNYVPDHPAWSAVSPSSPPSSPPSSSSLPPPPPLPPPSSYFSSGAMTARPVLRLSRLAVNECVDCVRLNIDRSSLRMLDLSESQLGLASLSRLEEFANLMHLSLDRATLAGPSLGRLLETVAGLEELRRLDLRVFDSGLSRCRISVAELSGLLWSLSRLEELHVWGVYASAPPCRSWPARKLKVLWTDSLSSSAGEKLVPLVADRIVGLTSYDGLLEAAEEAVDSGEVRQLVTSFYRRVQADRMAALDASYADIQKLETLTLRVLREGYLADWREFFGAMRTVPLKRRLSFDFLTKMACLVLSHYAWEEEEEEEEEEERKGRGGVFDPWLDEIVSAYLLSSTVVTHLRSAVERVQRARCRSAQRRHS